VFLGLSKLALQERKQSSHGGIQEADKSFDYPFHLTSTHNAWRAIITIIRNNMDAGHADGGDIAGSHGRSS
jgi:hypothetical protein